MARQKASKSEAIRQYLADHPDESAQTIAKTLKVKPALVYNVKSMMRSRKNGSVKRGRGRGRVAAASANGSVEQVIAAARLIKSCGGIEQARLALKAAEQVASALD